MTHSINRNHNYVQKIMNNEKASSAFGKLGDGKSKYRFGLYTLNLRTLRYSILAQYLQLPKKINLMFTFFKLFRGAEQNLPNEL